MFNKDYRPTLAQLRTFVTVAENRHFGIAAAKLGISQPSLSQALVSLETGLGVQLIERSTRKVLVTPTGLELLPLAKATLDAADAFLARSKGVQGTLTGSLTLGIIPTIAPYLLPDLLKLVHADYPELELSIVEDQTRHLENMLRDGQIDMALMAVPSELPGMREIPLYYEDFVVVVPEGHNLAGRYDLDLECLEDLDLLLLDDGHCLHDQIVELCRQANIKPSDAAHAITRASSLTTVMQLVVGHMGSTLVPVSAVAAECQRPGLATATFDDNVTARRRVGLVYRHSSAREEEFMAFGAMITRAFNSVARQSRALL
ncbi:LysR family transcriptional regulator [Corynebacterium sp. 3HC-13]|uniref:LysR substrate-binding domain-containing protein n=1 Tax=Corynebacterium poyangense TaxID=2684405 RepID=UPI001CCA6DD9|nr:hydrogen peroxide-inducible genes activator [Corynebacterium poyangense]MBZ8177945.1 LysR family transcriptional regulator [Corynebacterium poyangense]